LIQDKSEIGKPLSRINRSSKQRRNSSKDIVICQDIRRKVSFEIYLVFEINTCPRTDKTAINECGYIRYH
jgi:hypothetical protein